jgi:hypothetical protein
MAGPIVADAKALSMMFKTETRHGYESHVGAMLVRRGRDCAQRHEVHAGNRNGYLTPVPTFRDLGLCAGWNVPGQCDQWCSREAAEARGCECFAACRPANIHPRFIR